MNQEYQRAVTRICVETALLLLQHGAESAVVVQMAQRLGVATLYYYCAEECR